MAYLQVLTFADRAKEHVSLSTIVALFSSVFAGVIVDKDFGC